MHHRTSVFALPPELGEVDFSDTNQDLNRFQFKKIDTLVDNLHASAGDIRASTTGILAESRHESTSRENQLDSKITTFSDFVTRE